MPLAMFSLFVKYKNQLTCSQSRRRRPRRWTLLRWTCPKPVRRLARLMMVTDDDDDDGDDVDDDDSASCSIWPW